MPLNRFIPLHDYNEISLEEMVERSKTFNSIVQKRRTVRTFSDKLFPLEVIENCLLAAGSAPSGANKQPWRFVVISNPEIKKRIRAAAEIEERKFYSSRAPQEWLNDLESLGTDSEKPFLETAPYLIVIFEKKYEEINGEKKKFYYTKESVGIATGILITAIHSAGLVSLSYTPSPMNFLNDILERPLNEKPSLVLVVGYPADNTSVPDIKRKNLDEIVSYF
jgi:iodotyrosine deiodinase